MAAHQAHHDASGGLVIDGDVKVHLSAGAGRIVWAGGNAVAVRRGDAVGVRGAGGRRQMLKCSLAQARHSEGGMRGRPQLARARLETRRARRPAAVAAALPCAGDG